MAECSCPWQRASPVTAPFASSRRRSAPGPLPPPACLTGWAGRRGRRNAPGPELPGAVQIGRFPMKQLTYSIQRSSANQPLLPLVDQDVGDDGSARWSEIATRRLIPGRDFLEFLPACRGSQQRPQFGLSFLEGMFHSHRSSFSNRKREASLGGLPCNLFYPPPLFLPFGLRFRHGSCAKGICMVPRNEVPSNCDTSERRARAICLDSGFLRVIFCPIIALGLACCDFHAYAALNVWAMGLCRGKKHGAGVNLPHCGGLSCRGRI